jgi:hypothetical protein
MQWVQVEPYRVMGAGRSGANHHRQTKGPSTKHYGSERGPALLLVPKILTTSIPEILATPA